MRAMLRTPVEVGLCLWFLFALAACGGGGSGGAIQPAARNDSYSWTGNTRLSVSAATGLLANDPPGTTISAADSVTTLGGTVAVDPATGAFLYDPPAGLQNTQDTFSYTAIGTSAVATISLNERIWYVRNNTVGAAQGTLLEPFQTLAQAEAAADENDTIFVFAGDQTDTGQNTGIRLKNGQRLIGEGVGLRVNDVPVVDSVPEAVLSNAALAAAGDTPVVMLATGNEVAGCILHAAFNEAILAAGGSGHDLHDNILSLDPVNGRDGIRLLNVTGSHLLARNAINGAPRSGIRLANTENMAGDTVLATPVIAAVNLIRNTIANSARDGISVSFDGVGTGVALNLLNNAINAAGAGGADEGIDVDTQGGATLTLLSSRNSISGSGDEAIELTAAGSSSLLPFVANNSLTGSAATFDFRAATAAPASALCLELINNGNAAGNASFLADNGGNGVFDFFEARNDTLASRIEPVSGIAEGGCGIPLDGAMLFEANCGHCHRGNGLGRGTVGPNVTNATAAAITFQIATNFSMGDIDLTQQEIAAIAAALTATP